MGKRGRHRRKQQDGRRRAPSGGSRPRTGPGARREPDLMADVRRALRDPHPLGLLALASSLLAALDPRRADPFSRHREGRDPAEPVVTRDRLVETFLEVERPETSALLAVVAELAGDDDLLRARIRRELLLRQHPLPPWLARLAEVRVGRVMEMVHVLGDGDNHFLEVHWPTGDELTAVVYVDHNVGTIVKDAFVVPESLDALLVSMRRLSDDDPDTEYRDLDPAEARARITQAIADAAITYPPFETDTWPASRPLVEWIVRKLPEGGTGYERPEWTEAERRALADRFFASLPARGLDDDEHRSLLEPLLWFGTEYGPGDPMRWSPVAVEIVLLDWVPRKIVADAKYLAKLPDLLRAFVTFCGFERGIRQELVAETVAAIDRYEPEYQRIIRSPRPQGPAALLAAIGALDPDEHGFDLPQRDYHDIMLDSLRDAVGGGDALQALDTAPLPDEPFVWDGIPADVHARVEEVLALCDRCCDEMLDGEYRTACRRFLATVARGDPEIFRRRARADTAAAAVCWVIGKANGLFSTWRRGMYVKDLLAHFGLKEGSVSGRAATMLRAADVPDRTYGEIRLGSPEFLVSGRRAHIIGLRDLYEAMRTA